MRSGRREVLIASLVVLSVVLVPGGVAPNSPIRPGMVATVPAGQCTLNFIFDGPSGQVYVGIAAHCVEPGDTVTTTGYPHFGSVVYDDDAARDFALIQVRQEFVSSVSAEVKGHPGMPTGVTTFQETTVGDIVLLSGYGLLWSTTTITQEKRLGPLFSDNQNSYCADAPALWGDSGGPVLHQKTGKALGFVSALGVFCPSSLTGSTIQGAIAKATADGFPITLRTA